MKIKIESIGDGYAVYREEWWWGIFPYWNLLYTGSLKEVLAIIKNIDCCIAHISKLTKLERGWWQRI